MTNEELHELKSKLQAIDKKAGLAERKIIYLNIANWVADSGLNPEAYEADPYTGSTIVLPPKLNIWQ